MRRLDGSEGVKGHAGGRVKEAKERIEAPERGEDVEIGLTRGLTLDDVLKELPDGKRLMRTAQQMAELSEQGLEDYLAELSEHHKKARMGRLAHCPKET
jgi:hypothetical protein